jgi:hypothetical protein
MPALEALTRLETVQVHFQAWGEWSHRLFLEGHVEVDRRDLYKDRNWPEPPSNGLFFSSKMRKMKSGLHLNGPMLEPNTASTNTSTAALFARGLRFSATLNTTVRGYRPVTIQSTIWICVSSPSAHRYARYII